MSKDTKSPAVAPAKGSKKKLVIAGIGGAALLAAGVGGGVYATRAGMVAAGEQEDPNRPKLVKRSENAAEAAGEEGGEGKGPALKEGTVSVESDNVAIDTKKYEVTYFPIEQNFTANLADGSGFIQIGLSLATYFDRRVIENIQHQMVPLRSAVLLILSQQDSTNLASPEGKKRLQQQLTDAVNQVLREKEGFGGVHNVYFTQLVVQ